MLIFIRQGILIHLPAFLDKHFYFKFRIEMLLVSLFNVRFSLETLQCLTNAVHYYLVRYSQSVLTALEEMKL